MRTHFSVIHGIDIFGQPVNKSQVFHGKSLAVPEMSLSLRQLLDRHQRGGSAKSFNPVYRNDKFPQVEKMDKLELFELRQKTADFVQTTRGKLQSARRAADSAARRAAAAASTASTTSDNSSEQAEGKSEASSS